MESLKKLTAYLLRIPSINPTIATGEFENGLWWIKFRINIEHKLSWKVIQELGHVVNYLSINERLPTIFYPVSPPPYLNGEPKDYLSWVIESTSKDFSATELYEFLEERLPNPVENLSEWFTEEDDA